MALFVPRFPEARETVDPVEIVARSHVDERLAMNGHNVAATERERLGRTIAEAFQLTTAELLAT